jgi:hypothetical protein
MDGARKVSVSRVKPPRKFLVVSEFKGKVYFHRLLQKIKQNPPSDAPPFGGAALIAAFGLDHLFWTAI